MKGEVEEDNDKEELFGMKAIVSAVVFVEVCAGSVVPYALKYLPAADYYIGLLNTFSGGVILATGLIHLVPEVIEEQFEVDLPNEYPLGMVMMTGGFLLVFFLEQIVFGGHDHAETSSKAPLGRNASGVTTMELKIMQSGKICTDKASGLDTRSSDCTIEYGSGRLPLPGPPEGAVSRFIFENKEGLILLMALSAHGLLEGLVVGFQDDRKTLLILFASIASHKFAAAMALSSRFMKNGAVFLKAFFFVFLFSLLGPFSIMLGTVLHGVPALVHLILNGLASGTFVYIGAYEVVHEEFSMDEKSTSMSARSQRAVKFVSMVLGVVLISLIALIPHEHED